MSQFNDAFISYGRADSKAFAAKLYQQLVERGFKVWFDFEDIPLGVDFQNQIDAGIEASDNFLFIIAPHSINSPYCGKEVELALRHQKRIIPLLHVEQITYETWQQRNPKGTEADWLEYQAKGLHSSFPNMHPAIGKINWVYFRDGIDDFDKSLAGLLTIFERHRTYVHLHTRILAKALNWEQEQKQSRYLLVGDDRQEAEDWLKVRFKDEQPPCWPTDLHCEYITESVKNAQNLMTQVFLSYATPDQAVMQTILRSLRRGGFTVWTNTTDIQTGESFDEAINRGIEQTDTVVYLLSPDALRSEYCQKEIAYALTLNKRIIPVLIAPTDPEAVPPHLRNLQYIDLTDNQEEGDYIEDESKLYRSLREEAEYYQEHKVLLTKALKWRQQNDNTSLLLRGYNLRSADAWLGVAKQRTKQPPTPLMVEFIEESLKHPEDTSLDVMISYSRTDSDFARRLNEALQTQGKTTWFDQESIASGTDFQQEIYRGIQMADNIVFVLSPQGVHSPYCQDEVEYAASLNKRFVTVLWREVDLTELPSDLAKVQWIDFRPEVGNFSQAFSELIRTLESDRDHVHGHTKWSQRALEWQSHGEGEDLLLRGAELVLAGNWLENALQQGKRPPTSALQQQYIQASQALQDRIQQEAEAQRQRELAQAHQLAESAEAQRRAEEAARKAAEERAAEEEKARRVSQRMTLMTAIGTPIVSILLLVLGLGWRSTQIQQIETLTLRAEAYMRDSQPFDALVSSTLAELRLRRMWFFPPREFHSTIAGVLRQADQDVQERHRIEANTTIYGLALSPDESLVAIARQDGVITVWDRESYAQVEEFRVGENVEAYRIRFSPDSQSLFIVISDRPVQEWSVTGEFIQEYGLEGEEMFEVAVSGDGRRVVTGTNSGKLYLWDRRGRPVNFLSLEGGEIHDLNINATGDVVVAAGSNRRAHLWNVATDRYIRLPHGDAVLAADISPDGQSVFTGSWDRTLRRWDLQGQPLEEWRLQGWVMDMALAADGYTMAIAYEDGRLALMDLRQSGPEGVLADVQGHQDTVYQVQISNDGQELISGSDDRTVRFWQDLQRPSANEILPEGEYILNLRLGENEATHLVRDNMEGETFLFDLITGDSWSIQQDSVVEVATFNPVVDQVVTGNGLGRIQVWDLQGELQNDFLAHQGRVVSLSISPDGELLASGGEDGTVYLWDAEGNPITSLERHTSWVKDIKFSADGETLVTVSYDHTAILWRRDGTYLRTLGGEGNRAHDHWVLGAAFSRDGTQVATASKDRTVKVWDVATGRLIRTLRGHGRDVTGVVFVNDLNYLVSTSRDGSARLWDERGREVSQYRLQNTAILFANLSPDGNTLATVAGNGTLRKWPADTITTVTNRACDRIRSYLRYGLRIEEGERVTERDRILCDRPLTDPSIE